MSSVAARSRFTGLPDQHGTAHACAVPTFSGSRLAAPTNQPLADGYQRPDIRIECAGSRTISG